MDVANAENAGALFCQKKVSKEKATRIPLVSCASMILSGFAKRDFPVPLAKRGFLAAPFMPLGASG